MNIHAQLLWAKFSFDLIEQVRFALNSLLNTLNSLQVSNVLKKKLISYKRLNYFMEGLTNRIYRIALPLLWVLATRSYAGWHHQCCRGGWFWKYLQRHLFSWERWQTFKGELVEYANLILIVKKKYGVKKSPLQYLSFMGHSGVGNSAQRGMVSLKWMSFTFSRSTFSPAVVVKAGNLWCRALLTNEVPPSMWGFCF